MLDFHVRDAQFVAPKGEVSAGLTSEYRDQVTLLKSLELREQTTGLWRTGGP